MGHFASAGVFGRRVLRQVWRQCVSRHLSGSAMCAQFLDQKLCFYGYYSAYTEEMRAAEGQGVAIGTASCLCQKNSVEAACSKGKACLYLSAKDYVRIPSVWLIREEDACWEVQNWVKTLPDWLDVGIWFWFSSFSNSRFILDTYFMDEIIEYLVLKTAQMHLIALRCIYQYSVVFFIADP